MQSFSTKVLRTFRCSEDHWPNESTELLRGFHFYIKHTHTDTHTVAYTHGVYYVNTVKTNQPLPPHHSEEQVRRNIHHGLIDSRQANTTNVNGLAGNLFHLPRTYTSLAFASPQVEYEVYESLNPVSSNHKTKNV